MRLLRLLTAHLGHGLQFRNSIKKKQVRVRKIQGKLQEVMKIMGLYVSQCWLKWALSREGQVRTSGVSCRKRTPALKHGKCLKNSVRGSQRWKKDSTVPPSTTAPGELQGASRRVVPSGCRVSRKLCTKHPWFWPCCFSGPSSIASCNAGSALSRSRQKSHFLKCVRFLVELS